jgi:hypothetical protein
MPRNVLFVLCWLTTIGTNLAQDQDQPPSPRSSPVDNYCNSLLPADSHAKPLQQACTIVLTLTERLPNFLCDMDVSKYKQNEKNIFVGVQHITAHYRAANGQDSYDELLINGKASSDAASLMQGTWSKGEFGLKLVAAFAPQASPRFRFLRAAHLENTDVYVYEFSVAKQNNQLWPWIWKERTVFPGYEGKIWAAVADGQVLRLEMKSTDGVPNDFPITAAKSITDLAFIDFEDGSGFELPSSVRIFESARDQHALRQVITFSNCHKFRATSRVVTNP